MPFRPQRVIGSKRYVPKQIAGAATPEERHELATEFKRIQAALEQVARDIDRLRNANSNSSQTVAREPVIVEPIFAPPEEPLEAPPAGENEIAVYHNDIPLGKIRELRLEDREYPVKVRPRVDGKTLQISWDTVLRRSLDVESLTLAGAAAIPYWRPIVNRIIANPEVRPYVVKPPVPALVPYERALYSEGVEIRFERLENPGDRYYSLESHHFVVEKTGVYHVTATLGAIVLQPRITALQYAVARNARLLLYVNGRRRAILDVNPALFRLWGVPCPLEKRPELLEVYCPTGTPFVFLQGSEVLALQAGDRVGVYFATNAPYTACGRDWVPHSLGIDPSTGDPVEPFVWIEAIYGHLTVEGHPREIGVTADDVAQGIASVPHEADKSDVFAYDDGWLWERDSCCCTDSGARTLAVPVEVQHDGQTVFALSDPVPEPQASRLVINGVEYLPGLDYHIDTSSSPHYLVWDNSSISLSTEDTVVLHYVLEPGLGGAILGVS